jgi:hypothetical protein
MIATPLPGSVRDTDMHQTRRSFAKAVVVGGLFLPVVAHGAEPAQDLVNGCTGSNCVTSRTNTQARQGPNFYYLLPAGWELVDEGKFTLVLRSRDLSAGIINRGISGLLQPMDPQTFAYQMMTNAMHLANDVRFLDSTPMRPLPPYGSAAIMDVTYTVPNGRLRGVVISNVINVYNRTDGMITIAAAKERLWGAYADWLPPLAMMAINVGPDPYARNTVSGAILRETRQLNELATAYRDWSAQMWGEVAQFRARVLERQGRELGPMLTGKQWYDNPFGGAPIQQSTGPAVIWVSRNGDILPSDNPTFDPRTPTDPDWGRLVPQRR